MGNVLEENLYKKDIKRFNKIVDVSKEFLGAYCWSSIVGVSVFGISENYARKKELSLWKVVDCQMMREIYEGKLEKIVWDT